MKYITDAYSDVDVSPTTTLQHKPHFQTTFQPYERRPEWLLINHRRKALKTIRTLSGDPTTPNPPCLVSANQNAHTLLVKGRSNMPSKPTRPVLTLMTEGDTSMVYSFSEEEYRKGVTVLKNNKATV